MKRRILLIYALLLATFSLSAEKYWHGEAVSQNGKYTFHYEEFISYKSSELKRGEERERQENVEEEAEENASLGGLVESAEDFETWFFLDNSGMRFYVGLSKEDESVWTLDLGYFPPNSNKCQIVRLQTFNDFNSARKDFEKQRARFIKKLEAE